MIIDYGCGEREIEPSVWSLALYEQEFGSDLIQDVFGRQRSNGAASDEGESEIIFDYTEANWFALTRALWAMLKAADDKIPRFSEWAKTATGMNMYLLFMGITSAVRDGFFRSGPAVSEEAGEEQEGQAEGSVHVPDSRGDAGGAVLR